VFVTAYVPLSFHQQLRMAMLALKFLATVCSPWRSRSQATTAVIDPCMAGPDNHLKIAPCLFLVQHRLHAHRCDSI